MTYSAKKYYLRHIAPPLRSTLQASQRFKSETDKQEALTQLTHLAPEAKQATPVTIALDFKEYPPGLRVTECLDFPDGRLLRDRYEYEWGMRDAAGFHALHAIDHGNARVGPHLNIKSSERSQVPLPQSDMRHCTPATDENLLSEYLDWLGTCPGVTL